MTAQQPPDPAPQQSALILVVDDHHDSRDLCAKLLKIAGFQTAEAADGHEAIERTVALRPALILLDYVMPGLDGGEVIRRLRSDPKTWKTPVIALTGYGDGESQAQLRQAGANSFLVKPVNFHELLVEIRRVLEAGGE
jgi:CheY-like chemotaxis protein